MLNDENYVYKYDEDTLNKIQNLEFEILKDFIKFCEENRLNYYLYGGSLLGAIRHGGFIPWDDDIDVIMFRKDYEKFKKIFNAQNSDKYELLTTENYDDYLFLFSKISLKGTKFEEWWVHQIDFDLGINLDIFVLDYVSGNNFLEVKIPRILTRITTLTSIKLEGYPIAVEKIANFIHYILKIGHVKPKHVVDFALKFLTRTKYSKYVCDICALNHPQIYKTKYFGEGKKVKFKDIYVNIPEDYDSILKQIYGDYMILPPENERYNHIIYGIDFGEY